MIRGITVGQVKRFQKRWLAIEGVFNNVLDRADRKFNALTEQAIADRQAAIRVMSQEIAELNSL